MKRLGYFINTLFNVSSHEWPRIILSWLLKLFTQASTVMGSTILIALFVEHFGVKQLPFLYVISALFVVFGSVFFSLLLERFEKKYEIIVTTIISVFLLGIAPMFTNFIFIFYGLLFIVFSLFIAQLNIILALFIEELFSPLESQRTFPIIESSEPIGGIVAGIILTLGVKTFHLSAITLLYTVGAFLFLVIPTLLIFIKISNRVPRLEHSSEKELMEDNRWEKTKKGLRHIKGMPFLKGLLVVVFLQFAFVNLIEYQYTSVLEASLSNQETTHTTEHSHADALTHGLAFWHVMFSLLAFFTQIVSASRIHSKLGIIKSMQLHPAINMISVFIMLIKFSFAPTIIARGVFEVTTVMHRTSYHASFYVLKKSIREQVKEFMEGIARPLGVISGTIVLFGIVHFTPEEYQHTIVSGMMFLYMLIIFFVLGKMQKQYTMIAKKNLDTQGSKVEKLEAIEILGQKGHIDVASILGKHIHERQHEQIVRKIIETLGNIQDINAIPDIVKSFASKSKDIQLEAVQALTKYKNLGQHFFSQSFAKHRVIEALENLFVSTKSKKIKSAVIKVFKNINNADIIPFLLKVLESKDEEIVADAVYVCGLFRDMSSSYYIEKFLLENNPRIKSSAIIALWNFPLYRLKCLIQLTKMIESTEDESIISSLYALGEIRAVQEIPRIKTFLNSGDLTIRTHAAIALAKMDETDSVDPIIALLLGDDKKTAELTRKLLDRVPDPLNTTIKNILLHNVSHKIHEVLLSANNAALDELPEKHLQTLKKYYELLKETKEIIKIEEELEKRKESV